MSFHTSMSRTHNPLHHLPNPLYMQGDVGEGKAVDRIAWFHVPKTGSSFANTLMHLANTSLPANAFIQTKAKDLKEMVREFPMDTWFRIKF